MKELVDFIKNKCSQEEIQELVKELSAKEEPKKNDVPKSWEEYCNTIKEGYYIDICSEIYHITYDDRKAQPNESKNLLPTEELAEAFLAMMQLMSLRQAWIKDWKPDWDNENEYKYCIACVSNIFEVLLLSSSQVPLSFPTQEMAKNFLKCFRDLIEKAKVLI